MKIRTWIGLILLIVLIIIQFIRPEMTNPPTDQSKTFQSQMQVPENIASILSKACYDCHSHQTKWPWYSNVAPVSWLLVQDVNEGRKHLNLSDWGSYKESRKVEKLSQMAGEVTDGKMPLPIYLLMHSEAKLSDQEKKDLVNWCENEADKINVPEDGENTSEEKHEH
ncbi:heme-binding domain-containing protein [bacterium]|nr:heme-binding domain-containing protein [bacterium]